MDLHLCLNSEDESFTIPSKTVIRKIKSTNMEDMFNIIDIDENLDKYPENFEFPHLLFIQNGELTHIMGAKNIINYINEFNENKKTSEPKKPSPADIIKEESETKEISKHEEEAFQEMYKTKNNQQPEPTYEKPIQHKYGNL